jgi:hypothetical protein
MRLRILSHSIPNQRLGHLGRARLVPAGIGASIKLKTLRQQFVHRRIQRCAIRRRRCFVFDDFHATKQNPLPRICQRQTQLLRRFDEGPVKRLAHFAGQRPRRERLLQERHA